MTLQFITPYSVQLGIVGAGTMGSGIALTALLAGMPTILYDVSEEMLEKARDYIEKNLSRKDKQSNLRNLSLTTHLQELHACRVVIEAIPEDLSLKKDLFSQLDQICPPPAILATNTSTLAVTAIASATRSGERVAGMHFFNPAPVLPLVEVIRGALTSPDTVQSLVSLAENLGKTPVVAIDTPGFIVNRVARPFYGEALRLLGEGAASVQEIDQVVRIGGGFRMGPFQLMDLIGIDVNLAAMQSMYVQTFGEPRYRPHRIQMQMVLQKALGRKTGKGFYQYDEQQIPEEDTPLLPTKKVSREYQLLSGSWSPGIGKILHRSGYTQIKNRSSRQAKPDVCLLTLGRSEKLKKTFSDIEADLPADIPLLCQCADITLTEIAGWADHPERVIGFDSLFFANGPIATLVPSPTLTPQARLTVQDFIRTLGYRAVWIEDSPGLILPRIVCMLINEAVFAAMEGVAEAEKIDLAMRLGVNYPKGLLAWAKEIGYAHVIDVLDHLFDEFHEERYRAAPLLRRWARLEEVSA